MPVTMQVVARINGACQRPFLLIAPHVCSHDEQFDRSFAYHARINTLQPVIEPTHLQANKIYLQINESHRCAKAKVKFTYGICIRAMSPGAYQQFALPGFWCAPVLAHDGEVADGVSQKNVVPATHVECGHCHILVFTQDRHRLCSLAAHWCLYGFKEGRGHIMSFDRL